MKPPIRAALAAAIFFLPFAAMADALHERLPACLACHGEKGVSSLPQTPSLGAQKQDYVLVQLFLFREKLRKVDVMNEAVKGLTDDDLKAFADAVAKLPPPPPAEDVDAARIERAKSIIAKGRCNFCHASNLGGQDQVPRIADQREDYVLKTLREYKSNTRYAYDAAMASVVAELQDQDFLDLAYYLARAK